MEYRFTRYHWCSSCKVHRPCSVRPGHTATRYRTREITVEYCLYGYGWTFDFHIAALARKAKRKQSLIVFFQIRFGRYVYHCGTRQFMKMSTWFKLDGVKLKMVRVQAHWAFHWANWLKWFPFYRKMFAPKAKVPGCTHATTNVYLDIPKCAGD